MSYLPLRSNHSYSLVIFAVSVISVIGLLKKQRKADNKENDPSSITTTTKAATIHDDQFYLEKCHRFRLELKRPQQSDFRVAAILLLDDGSIIIGTNDEPSPNIAISMCAERCAFLKYRSQKCHQAVKSVFITADADIPISPGMGCREWMSCHSATTNETRIVMQSNDIQRKPLILSLGELQPFPSIYSGLTPREQLQLGESLEKTIQIEFGQQLRDVPGISQSTLIRLIKAARNACELDNRDSLHAVRYGAAMAVEIHDNAYENNQQSDITNNNSNKNKKKIEIIQASQVKSLEYSLTLDAICQLASRVIALQRRSTKATCKVLAVIQVDQFGVPHGPFAHARAFLVEYGFGDCSVILTTIRNNTASTNDKNYHHEEVSATKQITPSTVAIKTVPARDLAPLIPAFTSS